MNCSAITCAITSVTGLNDKTGLAYATSDTNIPATPTAVCATGYSQASNSTYRCLVTGAATSIVNNCALITCTITGVAGYNDKTNLAYASSSTTVPDDTCAVGYTGSPTYTCTTTGDATVSGCSLPVTCTFNGTNGMINGTVVNRADNPIPMDCNDSAWKGYLRYTCSSAGVLSVIETQCYPRTSRWVLVSSSVAKSSGANVSGSTETVICDPAHANQYVIKNANGTISGTSLLTNGNDNYYWQSCYCNGAGCSVSCGCCSINGSNMRAYQCMYD